MIESIVLLIITTPFVHKLIADEREHQRIAREAKANRPGLSSQAAQIKLLTSAQKNYVWQLTRGLDATEAYVTEMDRNESYAVSL